MRLCLCFVSLWLKRMIDVRMWGMSLWHDCAADVLQRSELDGRAMCDIPGDVVSIKLLLIAQSIKMLLDLESDSGRWAVSQVVSKLLSIHGACELERSR